eukprot:7299080-Prymnesium_polylepis.2
MGRDYFFAGCPQLYNDQCHAHDHYDYFRSLLGNKYGTDLDVALENVLTFVDEIRGVPVLLSLLVLIFSTGGQLRVACCITRL